MEQSGNSSEVGRLINLMPVGLKEAAIDSPTARVTVLHYAEQIDLLERWLDDYLKSTNRLIAESTTLENILNNFTSHAALPTTISETMLDHDYSVLAIKKYSEGAKDFWMSMVGVVKRLSPLVCEPIRQFQSNELKQFKEARRTVEHTQKNYDSLQNKFASQPRTKEPSALREDAFQLHEARKPYLRAMMDFYTLAPALRFSLDKLIVKIFHDQWREMKWSRENTAATFQRSAQEMERVKGWVREMEDSERIFKRETMSARRQLEDAAELAARPSRELDDYSVSTVPNSGPGHTHTASTAGIPKSSEKIQKSNGEKHGWLYLRTYSGKPVRVVWVRRWAFVRNGIFGWLVQNSRIAGVEESERIGVLLCSIRPLPVEERRFCFELKTNKNTIGLQAENQAELIAWLGAIEAAKEKAVHDPSSNDASVPGASDAAFAITAPPVAEFGTSVIPSTEPGAVEETTTAERTSTLPNLATESVGKDDTLRRATAYDDGGKDHASRIMSKLDLHKRTPTNPQMSTSTSGAPGGGIASLIAASHGSMPVGPSLPMSQSTPTDTVPRKPLFTLALRDMPPSTLAPSTLANVPAPTNLSKSAVVVSGERGLRGSTASKSGIPNGILANTWGSSNGSYVNRFERIGNDSRANQINTLPSQSNESTESNRTSLTTMDLALPPTTVRSRTPSPSKGRRQTFSYDQSVRPKIETKLPTLPAMYPIQLKTQDAQFRLLFPNIKRDERLVLVFRASWNPNDQQEFPGRVYVTTKEIYFYSNHFGLVLTSEVSLSSIEEVTAAPGKDCDFIFMHLKEGASSVGSTRITVKVFLEPLRVLQKRLNYLVSNSVAEQPAGLEDIIRALLKFENDAPDRSPSIDSWEEVPSSTPFDGIKSRSRANTVDLRSPLRIDRALYTSGNGNGDKVPKFKLPAQPVKYKPPGYSHVAVAREYDVSPKALFHVMFGDKSLLWQLLQHERQAKNLKQGPWISIGEGRLYRDFQFTISSSNSFGNPYVAEVKDHQFVDVNNDHLCYVVTDKRTPWHLPNQKKYRLVSKIVITHVAKSRCKLAIYIKVDWLTEPWYMKQAIERHAMHDLDLDAQDLADLVTDQVRKLGAYSRTKKAIQIFGQVGQSTETTQLEINASAVTIETRRTPVKRTMTGLLIQDGSSMLQNGIGNLFEVMLNFGGWARKQFNAHTVILFLLVTSLLYNSWFLTRDGLGWWQQRNTANFMNRIGVGPNHVMSKAVYLNDVRELMTADGVLPTVNSSACYKVFASEHSIYDLDSPIIDTQMTGLAKKAQSVRQRLGMYRHDLMVAMRVVNSIEKEVVMSEWEEWLTGEYQRCRQVEPVVSGKTDNATVAEAAGIREWYQTYCVSCNDEYTKAMAF